MDSDGIEITLRTLQWALTAVGITFFPAIVLGWCLARVRFFGKDFLETLFLIPLFLPPVATGLILLHLMSRRGWLGAFCESIGLPLVFAPAGVVVALAVMSFPLLVGAARASFAAVDQAAEDAAATLGASPLLVWGRVTVPLAAPGLLSGALLAFARALGEFGATLIVAGNIPGETQTLALALSQEINLGNDTGAFRYLLISLLLALVTVSIARSVSTMRVPSTDSLQNPASLR